MKKSKTTKKQNPLQVSYPWITTEMMKQGITARTLNYLKNPKKQLYQLSPSEFVYLWKQLGENFEKTAIFKRELTEVIEEVRLHYGLRWPEFNDWVKFNTENPHLSDLLRKFAPFEQALKLSVEMWQLFHLVKERGLTGENATTVFEKILDMFVVAELNSQMLINFRELVTGDKHYEALVDVMIDLHLHKNPRDYTDFIQPDMPFRRRKNMTNELINEKNFISTWQTKIHITLRALLKTRDKLFVEAARKLIYIQPIAEGDIYANEQKNYYRAYKELGSQIADLAREGRVDTIAYQLLVLPITLAIAEYMIGKEDSGGHMKMGILELIDEIDPKETKVITDKVLSLLGDDYARPEYCIKYYHYSRDKQWIDRFCADLEKFNYIAIEDVLKFFEETHAITRDSRVMEIFLLNRLPHITKISELEKLIEWDEGTSRTFGIRDMVIKILPKLLEDEGNRNDLPKILKYL